MNGAAALRGYERVEVSIELEESLGRGGSAEMDMMGEGSATAVTASARTGVDMLGARRTAVEGMVPV